MRPKTPSNEVVRFISSEQFTQKGTITIVGKDMKTLQNRISSKRRKAFTLIELMVVILILAILAALIVPKVMGRQGQAKIAAAKSDEATLASCLHQFRLDCDRYPTTEEGLSALITAPSGLENKAKEPYLTKSEVPNDPWGHPYVYTSPGASGSSDSFTITSYGADGAPGGTPGTESEDIIDNE
jgi:general secretion pathway protein G